MGGTDQDIEQPLLGKKKQRVYENCPGCRASYLQDPDAKLPMKELAIVSVVTLVYSAKFSSFPFVPASPSYDLHGGNILNLFCRFYRKVVELVQDD